MEQLEIGTRAFKMVVRCHGCRPLSRYQNDESLVCLGETEAGYLLCINKTKVALTEAEVISLCYTLFTYILEGFEGR